jgi:hypothetical protein
VKADLTKLPETVTAPRTDPVYNCHGYLTKVPIAAIEPFIQAFARPATPLPTSFYSDMNLFHEAWLGQITESTDSVASAGNP